MKKYIILFVIFLSFNSILNAQKNEYRYAALKFGITHNYNFFAARNNTDVMLRTSNGDMLKEPLAGFNYIPGGAFSFLYHLDSKTDKYGFVIGVEYQNNGFRSKYISENDKFTLVDQFRVQAVGVPFIFKFGGSNIYINQKYLFVGVEYNYFLYVQNIQKTNWNDGKISSHVISPINGARKSGFVGILGFNYYIFNFQAEYWASNYIFPGYQNLENNIKPYSHLPNFNIFLKTSVTVPLTRWLTTKSWTAERVRRIFSFGNRG